MFEFSKNVAINVRGGEKARKFYSEVLGFSHIDSSEAGCGTALRKGPLTFLIDDVESTEDKVGEVFFEYCVENLEEAKAHLLENGCRFGNSTNGSDFKGQMIADPYGMKFHLYQKLKD